MILLKTKNLYKMKVFISYSHKDKWIYEDNERALIPFLQRYFGEKVDFWYDPELAIKHSGEKYEEIIRERIKESKFAILLLSIESVASPFIKNVEMPLIKELFDEDEIKIIPILISPVDLKKYELFNWLPSTQILPSNTDALIDHFGDETKWQKIKPKLVNSIENCFFKLDKDTIPIAKNEVIQNDSINKVNTESISKITKSDLEPVLPIPKKSFYRKHKIKFVIGAVSVLIIFSAYLAYSIFKQPPKTSISYINMPPFDSLPQSEEMYPISGKISELDYYSNYRIVVYAHTNRYYIQPGLDKALTEINENGYWQTETRKGGEYLILLVKKRFEADSLMNSPPQKGSNIIEIFTLPVCIINKDSLSLSIYSTPPFNDEPKSEEMHEISGKISGLKKPQLYRFVLYVHTNAFYIQPGLNNPLTIIDKDGGFKIQSRLGGEYLLLLVKDSFIANSPLDSPPKKDSTIIEIFEITK